MLRVTIVTPFGEVFDGEAEQVVAPGYEGEFGRARRAHSVSHAQSTPASSS